MIVINIKITNGDGFEFFENVFPVDVRMIEFRQQFTCFFLQAVVVLDNLQKRRVLRRNLNIHRRPLQIDFQR